MKRRTRGSLLTTAAVWSAISLAGVAARADMIRHGGSELYWLDMPGHPTGERVPSASGLIRTEERLAGWVDTEGLPPNSLVTVWSATFNEPTRCKHPTVVSRCSTRDLWTNGTLASLQYANEGATDEAGTIRLVATVGWGGNRPRRPCLGADERPRQAGGEWGWGDPVGRSRRRADPRKVPLGRAVTIDRPVPDVL